MKTLTTLTIALTIILIAGFTTLTATAATFAPNGEGSPTESFAPYNVTDLEFYDNDDSGDLSQFELNVVIADHLHMRLTRPQVNALNGILGYLPIAGKLPAAFEAPEPVPDDRVEIIIDGNRRWYNGIVCDDMIITGNRNIVFATTDTLTIDGNRNYVAIRNTDISSIYFTDYSRRNFVFIPNDATPEVTDDGRRNHVWYWYNDE